MQRYSNFDLTNYNSYKIKSKCRSAYFPDSEDDIIELHRRGQRYQLIGSGHNIILSHDYYDDDFIILNGNFSRALLVKSEDIILEAEAGASMLSLSNLALENSLTGLEIFYDIPSSFGGAVVMNAGASGEEIKDLLTKVRYLDLEDMTVKEIKKDQLQFEYRNSFFQKHSDKIILKGWLKLFTKPFSDVREKMDTIRAARWAKQPKEYPNAGSVFKRPPGHYVGAIIDSLGLKGFTIGGAQISQKHGGFIVNVGDATGNDIISIISEVKHRVLSTYGIDIEIEQRII